MWHRFILKAFKFYEILKKLWKYAIRNNEILHWPDFAYKNAKVYEMY